MSIDVLKAFENPPKPLDYVLPGMIAGSVGAIVAPGGAGKSMLILQIAAQIAGGPDTINLGDYPPGSVVYLPAEDPESTIITRLFSLGRVISPEQRIVVADQLLIESLVGKEVNILDPRWTEALVRIAEGRRLMILDTLRRFHAADENDSGAMSMVIGRMEAIAKKTGCSIVFLHHASKSSAMGGTGDQQQASRGSSVLVDNIRWQGYLAGMTKDEAPKWTTRQFDRAPLTADDARFYVRFGVSKQNYGPPVAEQWLRRGEGGILSPADIMHTQGSQKQVKKASISQTKQTRNSRDDW